MKFSVMGAGKSLVYFVLENPQNHIEKCHTCLLGVKMHGAFKSDLMFISITSSLASLTTPRCLVGRQQLICSLCLFAALVGLCGAVRQL